MSSNLLMTDGHAYVVDCGLGISRQLILAGMDLGNIRAMFITHPIQTTLEFGNLAYMAWNANIVRGWRSCRSC